MFCISRPETATYGIAANSTISNCFDEGNLHLVGPTSDAFHISILMSVALVTERKYPSFISFHLCIYSGIDGQKVHFVHFKQIIANLSVMCPCAI